MSSRPPTDIAHDTHGAQGQAGFALYMAMGFIILLGLLVAGVSNQLNLGALDSAQRRGQQNLMLAADSAAQNGLAAVQFGGGALPPSASDALLNNDRRRCLATLVLVPTNFIGSPRYTDLSDDEAIIGRYFIAVTGRTYTIFGCAINDTKARQVMGVWRYAPPDFIAESRRQF